ncbi:galactokinase [Sphingobacterium hungaricum]|uniref:Galactokinase n=1 Tax=Sphingobacterium hungaricum TaxID=2082723 RepID=A0A928YQD0_9SPHI|nr:galactokinase [Sphingobacterium hungaricum]MBE8714086.1 galactokinase [Sphingobacterium hungaricum]
MITKQKIDSRFQELFNEQAALVAKSPGRINLIGEHTDYNEGFVLPTAIDKAIYVGVSKRNDNRISLFAEDFNEAHEISIDELAPSEKGWPNYILGVVNQFAIRDLPISGFSLYLDGDVPLGAGLSSSAAVECAVGFALNELFELGLNRVELAKIGQLTEHTYVGVNCGIMDQFASIMSKSGHVLKLDCRSLEVEYVPLELGEHEIVLLNTNVKHSLADSAYNKRRASCEKGVALVKEKYPEVNSLRDVSVAQLDELVAKVDADVYTKCKFVIEENERLIKACDALKNGNIDELGKQLFAAHAAISSEYEVSCKELDFLVDFAKNFDGVVGARMMGGGFGGCTINIVKKTALEEYVKSIAIAYKNKFGFELTPIFIQVGNGTELI